MATEVLLEKIADPAGWQPDEFTSSGAWYFQLSPADIDALKIMAASVRSRINEDPNQLIHLAVDAFSLGSFTAKLAAIRKELRDGLGVVLLRGLPMDEIELIDSAIIYWGLGRYLGEAMPNNPEGDMFGHVTDLGKTQDDPNSRGYQTREAMDYHCDQCDLVGLLCVRAAKSGGISKLASSVAMYNRLLEESPSITKLLSQPLYWTKHGEHAPDEPPFYLSPVFNMFKGRLSTSFGPKHIIKGYNLPATPAMSADLLYAIKRAEEVAEELHVKMQLERGDIQFVNNYVTLHTRTAYIDFDQPSQKRLLWRLWLMQDGMRERTDYAKQWCNGVSLGQANPRIRI